MMTACQMSMLTIPAAIIYGAITSWMDSCGNDCMADPNHQTIAAWVKMLPECANDLTVRSAISCLVGAGLLTSVVTSSEGTYYERGETI